MISNVTLIQFHRNGVGGLAFTEVRFTADYEGLPTNVVALVPEDYGSEVYMVSLDQTGRKWRGSDVFGDELRKLIQEDFDARFL